MRGFGCAVVELRRNSYAWRNTRHNQHVAIAYLGMSTVVVVQRRRRCAQQLNPLPKVEHLVCSEQSFLNTQQLKQTI